MDREGFRTLAAEALKGIAAAARDSKQVHEQIMEDWGWCPDPAETDGTGWEVRGRQVENLVPWARVNWPAVLALPTSLAFLAEVRSRVRIEPTPPPGWFRDPAESVLAALVAEGLRAVPIGGLDDEDLHYLLESVVRDVWDPPADRRELGILPVANLLVGPPLRLGEGLVLRDATDADRRRIRRSLAAFQLLEADPASKNLMAVIDVDMRRPADFTGLSMRLAVFFRLLKPCASFVGPYAANPRLGPLDSGRMLGPPPFPVPVSAGWGGGPNLDLRTGQTEVVAKWAVLERAYLDPTMSLVLRWFAKGSHDLRDEDGFLAQMVALETLMLKDLDKRDRGERSFRIALRVARFLGENPSERRRLFARVQVLYDVRSQLVHAGAPVEKDGTPIALPPLRIELDDVLRQLLWRWFSAPPDWPTLQLA